MWLPAAVAGLVFVAVSIYSISMVKRLYNRFLLSFMVEQVTFDVKRKMGADRYRMLVAALPALIRAERAFLITSGYWPQLYKGYLDCAKVDVVRGDLASAQSRIVKALSYHPYYTAALDALAAVYDAQGRKKRASCCADAASAILGAGWDKDAREAYVCCLE